MPSRVDSLLDKEVSVLASPYCAEDYTVFVNLLLLV